MEIIIEPLKSSSAAPMDLLLTADPSEELVRDYLARGECHVANYQSRIIGILVMLATRPRTIEIMNVAVKEEFQNQGVGRRLILHAIERAREKGAKTIEIGTGNPGVRQMLLYQQCGFRISGIDFDFFRKNYRDPIYENGIECRDMIRLKMDL
jgi:ribosomal protein S18 acetylase RimI-like enzyme